MLLLSGPAAFVCLETGWITTESGRQPWAIYNILKVNDSVTTATGILPWFGVFSVVYVLLMVFGAMILLRMASRRRMRLANAEAQVVTGD